MRLARRSWLRVMFVAVAAVGSCLVVVSFRYSLRPSAFPPLHSAPNHDRPSELNTSGMMEEPTWWRSFLCDAAHDHTPKIFENLLRLKQLFRDTTPRRTNTNVFLVDSGCNNHPKFRAWCSVESWAKLNPDMDVWFTMTSLTVDNFENLPMNLLQQYPNLHIVSVDLDPMFEKTPLHDLFNSRRWTHNDTWPVELLSDMLRVLVLWHWGGVYSDTDVICIKPFALPLNTLGYETKFQLGSAVYSFQAHHKVLWSLMEDMVHNFDPGLWGSIGPKAITRVMKRECGVDDLVPLLKKAPFSCGGVALFPLKAFFPVDYRKYKEYTKPRSDNIFNRVFRKSYTLHVWNKMSKNEPVTVGNNSFYEVAARRFCPLTFQQATLRTNTL